MSSLAASVFSVLALAGFAFQVALVAGAPWGELTLGGRWHGRLPPVGRAIAAGSAVLILLFAAIVLARAGLAFDDSWLARRPLAWGVVAYCGLGVLANAATRSRRERALWLPVVAVMLLSSLLVALA
ncbi:hypothetical protein [Uliginosibacterium sp. H1]|uniref:hypothetical protein n=1 Tax=Uliginosibacterium sp. H1 TaxID=3114757 RepID=UPI002E17C22A|nr:hypothetical protein [Uliginosibacterium sp. H1]